MAILRGESAGGVCQCGDDHDEEEYILVAF